MTKTLPVAWSGFSSVYLEPGLLLSVIQASGRYEEWMQTHFINLYASSYQTGSLIYRDGYLKLFYESTRPEILHSFFEMHPWPAVYRDFVAEGVTSELASDRYVMLDLDEFHIPGTYYAGRVHYWRRFLFYGYDQSKELFYAASHNRFTQLKPFAIPRALLEQAADPAEERKNIANSSPSQGMSLRLKQGMLEHIHYHPYTIYRQLVDYRDTPYTRQGRRTPRERTQDVYGFALYDLVIDRLELGLQYLEKADYRVLGMLAEQKAGLADRIGMLAQRYPSFADTSLIEEYRAMSDQAGELLRIMLRFGSAEDAARRKAWTEIIDGIRLMQQRDREGTARLIDCLEQL